MKFKTLRKRTLTLNLSDEEMDALEALADRQGMSKSAIIRQAITRERKAQKQEEHKLANG